MKAWFGSYQLTIKCQKENHQFDENIDVKVVSESLIQHVKEDC